MGSAQRGEVTYLGVRHHSPGCARSLEIALRELRPDVVLIEGPPEANLHLSEVTTPGITPPVALLISDRDDPRKRRVYPFTEYSPEWVALCYATREQLPVEMIDAPYYQPDEPRGVNQVGVVQDLETIKEEVNAESKLVSEEGDKEERERGMGIEMITTLDDLSEEVRVDVERGREITRDPLAYLAGQDGRDDHESWWDHNFERAESGLALFDRLDASLSPLRAQVDAICDRLKDHPAALDLLLSPAERQREARREAHMRLRIREARKRAQRVVVICGAWHIHALREPRSARADREILRGARRVKVEVSWVPWSDRLLTRDSGYGAGVVSPSWYHLLWSYGDQPDLAERALCEGADALRDEGHLASSASVIDAAQLSRALGSLRGRSWVELCDIVDAARSALCQGDERLTEIFQRRVSVGERYGVVPSQLINISLTRDFHKRRRQLRIKLTTERPYHLRLNLSRARDLDKSVFVHRAKLLGLFHQTPTQLNAASDPRERWQLIWSPQDEVQLNQHGHRGGTFSEAALHAILERVEKASSPDELVTLVRLGLSASLPEASHRAIERLRDISPDRYEATTLIELITQLAQATGQRASLHSVLVRHSEVNARSTSTLAQVINRLTADLMALLPQALASLSPQLKRRELGGVASLLYELHDALIYWSDEPLFEAWVDTLRAALEERSLPPVISGRLLRCAARSRGQLRAEVAQRFTRDVSRQTVEALEQWLIGLIASDPRTLSSESGLLDLIDDWLASLNEDEFLRHLPSLRRAFASCERRANESLAHTLLDRWGEPQQVMMLGEETLSQSLWSALRSAPSQRAQLFDLTQRLFNVDEQRAQLSRERRA